MTKQILVNRFPKIHVSRDVLGALLLIGALAVGLRLFNLDRRSLWIDEILQSRCASLSDLPALLKCINYPPDQAPLGYVVTQWLYLLLGHPPLPTPAWILRLPEVLAGLATVPLAAMLARELLGYRAGWIAACLWAMTPLAIAYSQEARMYAWLVLFSTGSALCLIKGLRQPTWLVWTAFGVIAALGLYSHYTFFFVLAGQGVFAITYLAGRFFRDALMNPSRNYKHAIQGLVTTTAKGLWGALVFALLISPWIPNLVRFIQFVGISADPSIWYNTTVPLTSGYLRNLASWLLLDTPSSYANPPGLRSLLIIGLAVLGLLELVRKSLTALAFSLSAIALPILYIAVTRGMPVVFRYWIFIQPSYYLLLAAGILGSGMILHAILMRFGLDHLERKIALVLGTLASLVFIAPGLVSYYNSSFDDWRGAGAYLEGHATAGDAVISLGEQAFVGTVALPYYTHGSPPTYTYTKLDPKVIRGWQTTSGRAWGLYFKSGGEGPFTGEQFAQWGANDFQVVEFSNVILLSPRQVSESASLAESAARLFARYVILDYEKAVPLIAQLLADYDSPDGANIAKALDWLASIQHEGPNLLTNPEFELAGDIPPGWEFTSNLGKVIFEEDQRVLTLASDTERQNVNAIQKARLQTGHDYILRFQCRNDLSQGTQRVYVSFVKPNNEWIVFPTGLGYTCASNSAWQAGSVGFQVPSELSNTEATIWLRNFGVGQVYFRRVSLTEIQAAR